MSAKHDHADDSGSSSSSEDENTHIVAPPSATLTALVALATEEDRHWMRLLGRSCARVAEIAYARDVPHGEKRLLDRRIYEVRTLDDDRNDAIDCVDAADGISAFYSLMGETLASGGMSHDDLFEYARRTMQDDERVVLYLLLYAMRIDSPELARWLLCSAADAHAGTVDALAEAIVKTSAEEEEEEEDDCSMEIILDGSGDGPMSSPIENSMRVESGESAPASDNCDDDSIDDDMPDLVFSDTQSDDENELDDVVIHHAGCVSHVVDGEEEDDRAAAERRYAEACGEEEIEDPHAAEQKSYFAWWLELGSRNTSHLFAYFRYTHTKRCGISFANADDEAALTLADRLVYFAAAMRAFRVLAVLLEFDAVRCGVRISVFDAVCTKMCNVIAESAQKLAGNEKKLERVLKPSGVDRVHGAIEVRCVTTEQHIEVLLDNARFLGALSGLLAAKDCDASLLSLQQQAILQPYMHSRVGAPVTVDVVERVESHDVVPLLLNASATLEAADFASVVRFACVHDDVELLKRAAGAHELVHNAVLRLAAECNSKHVLMWLLAVAATADNTALAKRAIEKKRRASRKLSKLRSDEGTTASRVIESELPALENMLSAESLDIAYCVAAQRGYSDIIMLLAANSNVDRCANECRAFRLAAAASNFVIVAAMFGADLTCTKKYAYTAHDDDDTGPAPPPRINVRARNDEALICTVRNKAVKILALMLMNAEDVFDNKLLLSLHRLALECGADQCAKELMRHPRMANALTELLETKKMSDDVLRIVKRTLENAAPSPPSASLDASGSE